MAEPRIWADGLAGTVIGADVWNGRTVLATDWFGGRLIAVTVEHGELTLWGDGYSEPESVSVLGDDALITERTGALTERTAFGCKMGPPWLLIRQVRRTQEAAESGFERSVDGLTGGADTVSGGRRGRLLLCGLFFDRLLERVPSLFKVLDTLRPREP